MNKITLAGKVVEKPTFSHEVYGEKFYSFSLSSERLSGASDTIPCITPDIFLDDIDENITVVGEIRTRNVENNGKSHLEIFVFVKEVLEYMSDINIVEIKGSICKKLPIRETPLGRKIINFVTASSRINFGKSDYVPSITWGRKAILLSKLEVGSYIEGVGRLQSREYQKNTDNGYETNICYELSFSDIKEVGVADEAV